MQLQFSPAAEADILEFANFIARDNIPRALSFAGELEASCAKLVDYPHSGVARPDVREGLRSKPYGNYVIFYSVQRTIVRIERILHGARDAGSILASS